jgi:hypothetical protein
MRKHCAMNFASPFASRFALGRLSASTPLRGLVVVVVTLVSTPSAYAKRSHSKGEESKEDLPSQARRACLSGDYESGVSILTDLFVRTKQPDWVYNQGRCLEQNARYEEAILRFEEYLRLTKGAEGQDRASAEDHIAECRSKLTKTEQSVPPPTRPETRTPPPVVAQEPTSSNEGVHVPGAEPSQAEPAQGRTGLRLAGVVAGVLGGASVATAVLFNLKANSMANDLNKPEGYDLDKVSQRKDQETLSWIGYGVGAAFLTGGAILLYLGYRGDDSHRVGLTPSVAPGQAGLSVQGAF